MALVTPAQAALFLRGLTSEDDPEVGDLIADADAFLASWLGWPVPDAGGPPTLEQSTYTEYRSGHALHRPRLVRTRIPAVISITSVHVDISGDYAGDESEITSAMRALRPDGIRLLSSTTVGFPSAEDGIRVVYVAGFDPASVPTHIALAVRLVIRQLWVLKSVEGLPNAGAATSAALVITPEIRTLIGRYQVVADG